MSGTFIAAAVRTAVGKAPRGALSATRPDDLAATVLRAALDRVPQLEPAAIDDVILGCAMPEGEQGLNVARIAAMRAGLPASVSAMTINRFCSSGLQAIALASDAISAGRAHAVLAGGTESMSMVPMEGNKFSANPWLVDHHPDVYLSMGLTAENVASKYGISREQADEFALSSHHKALAAIHSGKFDEEIVPITIDHGEFKTDEGPRADTSAEALAKLKPAFHAHGTVTAGNSSQTSDGAAAVVLISEQRARELGIQPMARLVSFATAGVAPEIMGIGPVDAIPKALKLAGLSLDQIDLIELNEAFAAQSLAVIQQARLDPARVNVNGGAIALGHPLGCTGARLMTSLLHEWQRRPDVEFALESLCIGVGQGITMVLERVG